MKKYTCGCWEKEKGLYVYYCKDHSSLWLNNLPIVDRVEVKKEKQRKYSIEDLLDGFLKFRKFYTDDTSDSIGEVDFEKVFFDYLTFVKGQES